MQADGIEVKDFWGSTLFHQQDLPFSLQELPSSYREFRERVSHLQVRRLFPHQNKLTALPAVKIHEGDLPTLDELGFTGETERAKHSANSPIMLGGECHALQRLEDFLKQAKVVINRTMSSIAGQQGAGNEAGNSNKKPHGPLDQSGNAHPSGVEGYL